jgi:hypothetical protein
MIGVEALAARYENGEEAVQRHWRVQADSQAAAATIV